MKLAIGAAISSLLMATAVSAASLSISGGTNVVLPGGTDPHDPDYTALAAIDPALVPTIGIGDTILNFGNNGTAFDGTNGLQLSHASKIRIMFLGKQANADNAALNLGGGSLSNKGAAGATITSVDLPNLVDLIFETIRNGSTDSIQNGIGQTDSRLSMGFYLENGKNALAFFGDGRGDTDWDDMVVRISIVPLPAGGLLLLSALGGFAVVRRKNKA